MAAPRIPSPRRLLVDKTCSICGFELYWPIRALSHSFVGLYDDARFPGRCIVTLGRHFNHLEDVPNDLSLGFFMDIRRASRAIRTVTGCPRVNVAILGNAESHVHAHLIPRYPHLERFPEKSPWNDERTVTRLGDADREVLIARLSETIGGAHPTDADVEDGARLF